MVNMYLMIGLPHTHCQYDLIWVFLVRMTKLAYFLPVHSSYLVEDYARLYLRELVKLCGGPIAYHFR